ncbi:hypothetical protein [Granulicella sp. dw_53]|uniref:hypothetical protein n=1 Tax=Granulicella sp. dw_53 TaxID=2719792 RepID=UPI001BD6BA2C|nr:hypothetical protein [Granulicella sp. dw_53]
MQTLLASRLFTLCILAAGIAAHAQSPLTEWSNEALNIRFNYPSDLTKADSSQALKDGHLTLLGISGDSDPTLAAATRCLRPNLLLQLNPTAGSQKSATILLAELDVSCLTPEQQVNAKDLLANMAELVTKVPGMSSIAPPAWYNVGWQKVHMAAAQGMPQGGITPPGVTPPQLFTMGFSTNWSNHLLVWYFSSNSTEELNRITKSTVRFGRSAAAPLYASTIGNSSNSAQ